MRFELTDTLGQFATLILVITILIKVWMSRLSASEFKSLLKFLAAVVFGVWLIGKFPRSPVLTENIGECQTFSNWSECGGWPIFSSLIIDTSEAVGTTLTNLLTFGPQIAGFLAALYFIMRINVGGYKSAEGVWKTTLGILLILAIIIYLPWIASEFNEIIVNMSNLKDTYDSGRDNFHNYLTSLEKFERATDEHSGAIIDLPFWGLKFLIWLLLLIPSLVSAMAYLAQLAILYGVPFSLFLAIFTRWQDLSTPVTLVIRYSLISVIKAFTWTTVSTISIPEIEITDKYGMMDLGMAMWGELPKLMIFALVFLVAGWILKRFVIGPAFTDIFNPRSQL